MRNYLVASSKDWFNKLPKSKEYKKLAISCIAEKDELSIDKLDKINPRYIFFPHWSWKVEPEIYERYECIAFHTAPLPFGRGGSPIQNLILRGFEESPICALRMNATLDSGPIYLKKEVRLDGNLDEIFTRIARYIEEMIINICENNPEPVKQEGNSYTFKRLTHDDNELESSLSLKEIYDRIRMVDGDCYQNSYINFGEYKIEFKHAEINNNEILAKVRLFKK